MTLRDARSDDADAIGRVHVDSWRAAYPGIVPEAHLAALSPVTRAGQWRNFLADAAGARFLIVADDEAGELVGFAAGGPERSGNPNYLGELYAIYNTRGRTFYEALGGVVMRTQPIEIGGAQLIEIAYGWSDLAVLLKSDAA